MFQRRIFNKLSEAVQQFPAVVLTGPRQSGKTLLLREQFPTFTYINLEDPDTLLWAKSDPRALLARNKQGLIIDEAQCYPALFSYLQGYLDEAPKKPPVILSGSQNFLLVDNISQSLAGRVAIFEFLPLTYEEYMSDNTAPALSLWEFLYSGSYPRPYHESLDVKLWRNSYIRTYLERDVRSILNVRDLSQFQLFLKLCAGQHGQLLNLNNIARDCGVSFTTANKWIGLLEASYIVYRLQPYHNNYRKRLVKTPKLYFYDSGLVCQLLGIESADHLQMHAQRGEIFEGFVITEIVKHYFSKGERPPIYFWRDHTGLEVDCILDRALNPLAIEIKSTATATPDIMNGLRKWQAAAQYPADQCVVVYAGDQQQGFKEISLFPFQAFYKVLD